MGVGANADEPRAFAYDLRDGSPNLVNLGTLGSKRDGRYSYATAVDAGVVVGASTSHAIDGGARGFAYDLNATTPRMIDLGGVGVGARTPTGRRGLPRRSS